MNIQVQKKLCFIGVLLLLVLHSRTHAATLCMGPMPGQDIGLVPDLAMSEQGRYISPDANLLIRIADKEMDVSTESGGIVQNLASDEKHLVEIKRNGKTIQSFWMNFEGYNNTNLCLWYYKGYGTISLISADDKRCKCQKNSTNSLLERSSIPNEEDVIGLTDVQLYSKYPETIIPSKSFLILVSKNLHPYHAPDDHIFLQYGENYIVFELKDGIVIALHKVSG